MADCLRQHVTETDRDRFHHCARTSPPLRNILGYFAKQVRRFLLLRSVQRRRGDDRVREFLQLSCDRRIRLVDDRHVVGDAVDRVRELRWADLTAEYAEQLRFLRGHRGLNAEPVSMSGDSDYAMNDVCRRRPSSSGSTLQLDCGAPVLLRQYFLSRTADLRLSLAATESRNSHPS